MDPDAAKKALEETKTLVAELEAYDGTIEQHYALLRRTDKMREAMERPYDVATRWMETMSCAAAMNFVIRTGIIDKLPRGGEGVTVSQLASSCRVDALTLRRALRVMAADGIFQETAGVDEYADTTLSTAFRSEGLAGFITMCVDLVGAWFALPKYCETHEPEDLADIRKSPFAFAAGLEGKTYYEVLDQNPVQRGLWNKGMQSTEKHFPIVGMFPFQDLSARVAESPERPYIVDVGGGRGQALLAIREHYGGDFGGELVLQDLPIVIDALRPEEIPGIKPMTYDIFTPQPVKGKYASSPCLSIKCLVKTAIRGTDIKVVPDQAPMFISCAVCFTTSMTPKPL